MTDDTSYEALGTFLAKQGHDEQAVKKILAKLAEYDRNMVADSIFDSLENGTFTLEAIVAEALQADGEETG
jgi:ferritin